MNIEPNPAPTPEQLAAFIQAVDFALPPGYLEFMQRSNGAHLEGTEKELLLWPLHELAQTNADYNAEEFYPGLFIIGTYWVGEACTVEKATGRLYMTPFIGDSEEDAIYIGETFAELLAFLDEPY